MMSITNWRVFRDANAARSFPTVTDTAIRWQVPVLDIAGLAIKGEITLTTVLRRGPTSRSPWESSRSMKPKALRNWIRRQRAMPWMVAVTHHRSQLSLLNSLRMQGIPPDR